MAAILLAVLAGLAGLIRALRLRAVPHRFPMARTGAAGHQRPPAGANRPPVLASPALQRRDRGHPSRDVKLTKEIEMTTNRTIGILIGPLLLALLAVTGCSSDQPASGNGHPPEGLTATKVVAELSKLYPMSNPRDNTGNCSGSKPGDGGCVQLITTDAVSVYQFAST